MAMLGNKRQAFGAIPGMGMMQPQLQGPMAQPQVGAMDPNTQAMTKKPGFFAQGQPGRQIIGVIGDTLSTLGGGQGTYIPHMMQMQQQDAEIRARLQEAIAKRQAEREDKQWEWQNKPKEPRYNDTIDDFNWYKSLSDEDKKIYGQMKPEYRQGPDGKFYRVETAQGPLPTFTPDDWDKGQPVGGSVGNGTGGFR